MNKLSIKELMKNRKKKGFTLIELIIVIAIIAILAAMAIPKFSTIRTEAKVSNDVASAKNIQTITATLIANGTWEAGKTYDSTNDEIKNRLDGKIAKDGNAEASGKPFSITIESNENIIIGVALGEGEGSKTYELYPDANGEGRKSYLNAVK